MLNKIIIIGIAVCSLLVLPGYSQVKDWGDVSRAELQMESYPLDSSAAAVVLFQKGNLRVEDNLNYYLDKHVRIKILREEGYKWGTVSVDYNTDYEQEVEDIEAVTYTLGPNGQKIKEHELGKKSVYEQEIINDWSQKKFTLPSLEPGCIIEYKYTLALGDPSYIPTWYFDETIPVAWNELTAEFPSFLRFLKIFRGDEELYINESEEFHKTIRYKAKTRSSSYAGSRSSSGAVNFNGTRFKWVMKDREAIEDLPFMTTADDYKAKIDFQLAEFNIPNQTQHDYLKSWENVFEYLLEEDEFGSFLSDRANFGEIPRMGDEDDVALAKVRSVFQHVAESYSWNNTYGVLPDKRIKDVIERKTGSGAELNLLLTRMLREEGIEASPILISTRDHGKASKKYVLPNQFNHVIVLVQLSDHDLLLDVITGNRPLYNLPKNDINRQGLWVERPYAEGRWIDIVALQPTVKVGTLQAQIKGDGSIKGSVSYQATGYEAFDERNALKQKGEDRFAGEEIFADFKNVEMMNFSHSSTSELDSAFTYTAVFDAGMPAATQGSDSLLYLDSAPFMKWKENPFKHPKRKYPVNFVYPLTEQFVTALKIPEGYNVESLPDDVTTRIARNGGLFKRTTEIKDEQILIRSTIKLGRTTFSADEYTRLRSFFNQVIESHSGKIILKKQPL